MPREAASLEVAGRPTRYAQFRRHLLEAPGVGVPGLVNFLDGCAAAAGGGAALARRGSSPVVLPWPPAGRSLCPPPPPTPMQAHPVV
jgi:hypothetical protein